MLKLSPSPTPKSSLGRYCRGKDSTLGCILCLRKYLVDLLNGPWQTEFNSLGQSSRTMTWLEPMAWWIRQRLVLRDLLQETAQRHHPAVLHRQPDRQHGTPLEGGGWDWQGRVHLELIVVKHLKIELSINYFKISWLFWKSNECRNPKRVA